MPTPFTVKPTHKTIQDYYAALRAYADQAVDHEGAVRTAFQNLLAETGRRAGWTLIPELPGSAEGRSIRPDGTFRDAYIGLPLPPRRLTIQWSIATSAWSMLP